MPKSTFFRLPEEKQQRLMDAAVQEFTRAPFAKASISNIITLAKIPRGSFYQYFEDKQDVFFYMVDGMGRDMSATLIRFLDENDGDLLPAIRMFFDYVLEHVLAGEQGQLFQNVFVYMDFKTASHTAFGCTPQRENPHKVLAKLLGNRVQMDKLKLADEHELYLFMRTVMGILMQCITSFYNAQRDDNPMTLDEAKETVQTALNWLETGVLK